MFFFFVDPFLPGQERNRFTTPDFNNKTQKLDNANANGIVFYVKIHAVFVF